MRVAGIYRLLHCVRPRDEDEVAEDKKVRAIWVLAKQDGEWLLTAYQTPPIAAG